jgi:hypothetical protein
MLLDRVIVPTQLVDCARGSALLHGMSEFMREQRLPRVARRRKLAFAEHDVVADGVGASLQSSR